MREPHSGLIVPTTLSAQAELASRFHLVPVLLLPFQPLYKLSFHCHLRTTDCVAFSQRQGNHHMPFQGLYSLTCSCSPSQCFQLNEVSNRLMKTWKAPYRYKVLCCRSGMTITTSGNVWEWLYCWTVFHLLSTTVEILGEEGKAFSVFLESAHMATGAFPKSQCMLTLTCAGRIGWLQEAHFGAKTLWCKKKVFQSHLKCLQKAEPREPFIIMLCF